jgi:transposase
MPCRATARPSSRICSPEVRHLDERVGQYDVHVRAMARDSTSAQQLMQIVGIGEVTATAIVATVGNAREFSSSRQFAAWLGLVPGQYSSGGTTRLGHITKAGDAYLRGLLVMGARAVLNAAGNKTDSIRHQSLGNKHRAAAWLLESSRGVAAKKHASPGPRSPRALRSPCQLERGRNARSSAPASFVSCVPLGAIAALTHEFLPPRD